MKYAHVTQYGKLLGWYTIKEHGDNIPKPHIVVSEDQWQLAIDLNHNKVNQDGSTELFDFRTDTEKQSDELAQKIYDANVYMASTDWVEPYILRHQLGINVLPDDSNKLAIHLKREETRAFLRAN